MVPSSGGPGSRPRQQQYENRSGSNPIGENSSSTERWEDVPRGTMDEVSSYVRLVLPSTDGKAARKIVPPRLRIPYWKGLGADSEEKHEPVSDIDTVVVDSLKALDPKRPIREADHQSVASSARSALPFVALHQAAGFQCRPGRSIQTALSGNHSYEYIYLCLGARSYFAYRELTAETVARSPYIAKGRSHCRVARPQFL